MKGSNRYSNIWVLHDDGKVVALATQLAGDGLLFPVDLGQVRHAGEFKEVVGELV